MPDLVDERTKPIEAPNIIRSGRLHVGDGHELYWVDWGNPSIRQPIFHLHGGPGGGFSEYNFDQFDPEKHRVVFHDQRGAGRSTPFASIKHNTSQDLVGDITRLRKHLGFDKISLYGFSWGATLALLYAIDQPKVVEKMLIGGIYLATQAEQDYYVGGGIALHYPEVWERFVSVVPKKHQKNVGKYYQKHLLNGTPALRAKLAKEWMVYESSILKLDYRPQSIERGLKDFAAESLAYLEAHYILNNCFIPNNFIVKHAHKLKDTKVVIVQGRYDIICPPTAARKLHQALPNSILQLVLAGHSRSDVVPREVIQAYLNLLFS